MLFIGIFHNSVWYYSVNFLTTYSSGPFNTRTFYMQCLSDQLEGFPFHKIP